MRPDQQICLATGGASGIGRATCEALAALGAHVVVFGVSATVLPRLSSRS